MYKVVNHAQFVWTFCPIKNEIVRQWAILVRKCPMSDHYFKHCMCLTFLGFELDSQALEMQLPCDKLLDLQQMLSTWSGRRSHQKKEFESLVAKLSHTSRVVQPGKTFLGQLFELVKGTHKGFHHICLNVAARSNIYWWSTFVWSWNGF